MADDMLEWLVIFWAMTLAEAAIVGSPFLHGAATALTAVVVVLHVWRS